MAYTSNEKSTGLDVLVTLANNDVFIVGDVSDSGRAKAITTANVAVVIATEISNTTGLVESVTGLNTNNADPANPIVQISVDGVTITGDGTPGNPLVATGGSGTGAGALAKSKSYSLEGLVGTPVQNGYQNVESYITSNGTTVYAELDPEFLQSRDVVGDWAAATQINSYAVVQGYLFLLLEDTNTTTYRVYRYALTNLSAGGTLMTIAGQAFSTQDLVMMTSDGIDFYFNYQAGNSTNDYIISKYTMAGTTLTFSADITCGAVIHATDVFVVDSAGDIYGLNTTGVRQVKQFDNTGTLQNTYGPYDTLYTNIINWDDAIYIVKSSGDDEAYRITPGSAVAGGSHFVGTGEIQDSTFFNTQIIWNTPGTVATIPWTYTSLVGHASWLDAGGLAGSVGLTTGILKNVTFDTSKKAIAQYVAQYTAGDTTKSWHGFVNEGQVPGATGEAGAFFYNDGGVNLYASTYDGATQTDTVVTGVTLTDKNTFRIEMDPQNSTPQVRFYVNSILVATNTTDLPFVSTDDVGFGVQTLGAGTHKLDWVSAPSFSIEL